MGAQFTACRQSQCFFGAWPLLIHSALKKLPAAYWQRHFSARML
jgi:hypothetical protein